MAEAKRLENLRRLLLAAVPLLIKPAPLPPILQPVTSAAVMAHLADMASFAHIIALTSNSKSEENERARPEQGGQRITEDWLHSLKSRDCQWRFRSGEGLLCSDLLINFTD
jgi:hypothetical protein